MRVKEQDYQRMCALMHKQKYGPGLTEDETKKLWQLKQANMKDNREYLEG